MEMSAVGNFLQMGGPAMWAIALLSVCTAAVVMWKVWRLVQAGVWSSAKPGGKVDVALQQWIEGNKDAPARLTGRAILPCLVREAMKLRLDPHLSDAAARDEVTVLAKGMVADLRSGLRALELIVTIAPLLGLFGTVLGMIDAFQTLQAAGSRADPSALAGGIWEALLTTAAGMGVAIPAAMALSWFDGISETMQERMESAATRVFTRGPQRVSENTPGGDA
jgi:biopolymer transport protein ExbB